MDPLLGLAVIIGVVGACLVISGRMVVTASSGEMHDVAPRLLLGKLFPAWIWRLFGAGLCGAAALLMMRVVNPPRLEQMWGTGSVRNEAAAITCRVIGSHKGVPRIGYLINPAAPLTSAFDFRFVTSEYPARAYCNDEEITPPAEGMILLVNGDDGILRERVIAAGKAMRQFGRDAGFEQSQLKEIWILHGTGD